MNKSIQYYHERGYTRKGAKYPGLPEELAPFYLYPLDSGHSLMAIPKCFEKEAKEGNAEDYECPICVKFVLEKGYTIEGEFLFVDVPYRDDLGVYLDQKYYEF